MKRRVAKVDALWARRPSQQAWVAARVVSVLVSALGAAACGNARSPGPCPAGTVLKGSDCIPWASAKDDSSSTASSSSPPPAGASDDDSSGSKGSRTAYDKEAVEVELKRAVRQIKAACGSATNDEGDATGPWGSAKVTVTIGRNGHIKQVSVPAPYDGKPVGECIVRAFQKVQFPPYHASSDATMDWDVELVQPPAAAPPPPPPPP